MYKLVIADDEGKTTTVPLVRDEITIGRKEGNTIRLTERNVSRRHARLQKQNGHYLLQDLGSYNGIVINGARLGETRPLRAGDQIQIGDYKLAILEEGVGHSAGPSAPGSDMFDAAMAAPAQQLQPHATAPAIPSAMGGPLAGMSPGGFPDVAAPQDAAFRAAPPMSPDTIPAEVRELRLVFLAPAGAPPPFQLDRLPIILGRSEVADVSLPFSSISREHARISYVNGELIIEDLGSSNGLNINGAKMPSGPIGAGDMVTMGVVEMRVARRGDDTVLFRPDAAAGARRKSSGPILVGVLGGGAVLGLVAFFLLRAPSRPPSPTASALPVQTSEPAVAPTVAAATVAPTVPGTLVAVNDPPTPAVPSIPESVPAAVPAVIPPGRGSVVAVAPTMAAPVPSALSAPPNVAPPAAGLEHPAAVAPAHVDPPQVASAPEPVGTHTDRHAHPAGATPPEHPAASPAAHAPGAGPNRPGLTGQQATAAAGTTTPLAAGLACHAEPNCVIGALGSGRAHGMQELEMLAAAYRQTSRRGDAVSVMRTYLQRYPSGPRADTYRNYIEDN